VSRKKPIECSFRSSDLAAQSNKGGSAVFEVNTVKNNVVAALRRGAPMFNNDWESGTLIVVIGGNGKMICRDRPANKTRI
jgi:hypothetical protein